MALAMLFPFLMIPHMPLFLAVGGCSAIFVIIPVWRISEKAGFSPAWSLLFFIPLAGLIYLWVLAFSEWPSPRSPRPRSA